MNTSAMSRSIASDAQITTRQAILTGWLLCGVLDITAACLQAWIQAGRAPADVLRGVASALWGRAALEAGAGMAAIGLAMHFTVALTATLVFYALSRRMAFLRTAPLWIAGPLYGVVVFSAMNYGTLPALSWLRSLYLHTPPRWPGLDELAATTHPHGLRWDADRVGGETRAVKRHLVTARKLPARTEGRTVTSNAQSGHQCGADGA